MSEKPISPLRQRMLEDMGMRRFSPDTQREYIREVMSPLDRLTPLLPKRADAPPA
jgi:hypothetical protein